MAYQRLREDALGIEPSASRASSVRGSGGDERRGSRGPSRDLFEENAAQQNRDDASNKPWWQANFFLRTPTLFGTWDGVFTTVMINIFGVLIFLRMGWVVGFAGVGLSILIIFLTLIIGALTVMSIIGLITRHVEHCRIQKALADESLQAYDVFAMIGFVLGQRISGSVGLVYAFGHAVAVAMYAVGLGEAMSDLFHWSGPWPVRGVALVTVFILLLVVMAGVRWVVKLQMVLMVVLGISILDFILGTMVSHSPANGVLGYSSALLRNNTDPAFTKDVSFFKVFGVFFPTITGVAGGLNMACDLKTPARSVPIGSTTALFVSGVSWITMTIMLGATCTQYSLQTDSLIEYRVSAVGALFLIGLYISSLSSCLAVFYGAPRVLQSMGRAKIVPILSFIGRGRGPNQEPFIAIIVVGIIAFVFVFVGHLNTLAMVISMPFLLTYTVLNYAYFSLAMNDDGIACEQDSRKPLNRLNSLYQKDPENENAGTPPDRHTPEDLSKLPETFATNGDARQPQKAPWLREADSLVQKRPLDGPSLDSQQPVPTPNVADSESSSGGLENEAPSTRLDRVLMKLRLTAEHRYRYESFILDTLNQLVSRWVSLLGSLLCFVAMFIIHWGFALAAVCAVLILYIYIGHANPSIFRGESAFSLPLYLQNAVRFVGSKLRPSYRPPQTNGARSVIVTQPVVPFDMSIVQLTQDSQDYLQRERVHHSVRQSHLASEFGTSSPGFAHDQH